MMQENTRILIVDDNKSIHQDFVKVLCRSDSKKAIELEDMEEKLFGDIGKARAETESLNYRLDHAYQGQEALEMVRQSEEMGEPYAMIFMDVRMPPGWDGVESIARIWKEFPYIEMVICTAFSDYSWDDILTKLGATDRLLFLKKPFDAVAVRQMTLTLVKKWNLGNEARQYVHKLESEVRDRTSQLEVLLSEMESKNSELRNARDLATNASREKSNFIQTVSDEIRQPMSGVMGMTNLLLDTDLTNEQFMFVDTVRKSCEHLISIINDILDFSKIDANKMELESSEFNIKQSLANIVELYAESVFSREIEFVISINENVPDMLCGDPGRIRQLMCNLLSNAVRFTEQGQILIRCGVVSKKEYDLVLRLEVEDTGIGISDDIQNELFKPSSLHNAMSTKKNGESSLGLPICKQLVELMKGKIGMSSKPEQGSCFWIELPLKTSLCKSECSLDLDVDMNNRSVLVVDDSETTAEVLRNLLVRWKVNVVVTYSSEEAMAVLADRVKYDQMPEFVIIDLAMPKDEGLVLIDKVTKLYGKNIVKFIVMTSHGMRGDAKLFRDMGVSAYLTKPVRESMLKRCLQMVLAGKAEQTMLTRYQLAENQKQYSASVLVADDNMVTQKITTRMLENHGCRVTIASNGIEAVKACEKFDFELVFMNCIMPEMDGYEAAISIRKWEAENNKSPVPMVAITTHAHFDDKQRCLTAGMNDYLTKPVKISEIEAVLKHWLAEQEGPDSSEIISDDSAANL